MRRLGPTPLAIMLGAAVMVYTTHAAAQRAVSPVLAVSVKRIFAESSDGKAQITRLQTVQQQRAADLQRKQQALEATRRELAQAATGARAQLQQQELQQRTDLERSTAQAQAEVQSLSQQLQQELQGRVKSALDELVKGRNVEIVLNQDAAVVWASTAIDYTDAVIQRMNAKPAKP